MPTLVEKPALMTHREEEGKEEPSSFGGPSSLQLFGEGLLTH